MTCCPECGGSGRIAVIPWTSWMGRPEQNPENEVDYPCTACDETGELHWHGLPFVEALDVLSRAALTPAPKEEK